MRLRMAVQALLLSVIAYWTLVHMAFFGDPRFHAPVLPVVAILAAVAVMWVMERTRSTRSEA